MDQSAKQQIIERLKTANNVLVTVSANPSVDQLAACIGFTLLLNKLKKHGTAVFSGSVPSTIEFLQPEETLEKNTDSLRDFIIALDKAKADKLRYKVEDKVVKIFITPYRTSLSDKDLDFSQGDFNVDVVLGLGVRERTDLDEAIVTHGRILHDATVISVNNHDQGNLGTINWVDLNASSLCEMMVDLGKGILKDPMDAQMATAFMTGIVAETDRFSNDKTSPRTMSLSAELMSAGANQQLIASKLEPEVNIPRDETSAEAPAPEVAVADDGSLTITHEAEKPAEAPAPEATETPPAPQEEVSTEPTPELSLPEPPMPQISKARVTTDEPEPTSGVRLQNTSSMVLEPPTMGGRLTANSEPEHLTLDPSTDPLSVPSSQNRPILSRGAPAARTEPAKPLLDDELITRIETEVASPHVLATKPSPLPPAAPQPTPPAPEPIPEPIMNVPPAAEPKFAEPEVVAPPVESDTEIQTEHLEDARDAVSEAIKDSDPSQNLEPLVAIGAQPVNLDLRDDEPTPEPSPVASPFSEVSTTPQPMNDMPAVPQAMAPPEAGPVGIANVPTMPLPPSSNPMGQGVNPSFPANLVPNTPIQDQSGNGSGSPTPPPPVPPPMMPPNL